MKVFFDTNVYIAEALLGAAAERMIATTEAASWRIFVGEHVLEELERVMVERLKCSRRLAILTRKRAQRRASLVDVGASSRHVVPADPQDSPVLQAALKARVDYLVTNDAHLQGLSPYEGLRVVSMGDFYRLLEEHGLMS